MNFSDYGVSWDERAQREIGTVSYNYLVHDDPTLLTYRNRDYGVAFELPLVALEKLLGLEDSRDVFLMRHLVSHLFFLFCLWSGYWLIFGLFNNQWLAACGILLVVLNPQLYAHSFFNTKDIPFMSMFFVCFLFVFKSFREYRYTHFILAGAAIGLLVNLRIMGIMLLGMMLFFLAADIFRNRRNQSAQLKSVRCLFLFLLSFWFALYFSWPSLFKDPLDQIAMVFSNMSRFRWESSVLYLGEIIKGSEIPWHYPLVWFGVSNPLVFVLLGIAGLVLALYQILNNPLHWLSNNNDRQLSIYLICFILPFVAVIALESVLYDSWRHLYFVYPSFVMLVIFGIHSIPVKKLRYGAIVLLVFTFTTVFAHMIVNHPHQHVFFNFLVNRPYPNHERKIFDLDYWGLSYREGLAFIAQFDQDQEIRVRGWNPPAHHNMLILPQEDRERLIITDENPKYFITAYRWHPDEFPFDPSQEVFRVNAQNNTILSVFKLNEDDVIPEILNE